MKKIFKRRKSSRLTKLKKKLLSMLTKLNKKVWRKEKNLIDWKVAIESFYAYKIIFDNIIDNKTKQKNIYKEWQKIGVTETR